jgi:hypothetical protein
LTLGDCFFTPERGTVRRHLWLVVSDPTKETAVVIVNVSTKPSPSTPIGDRAAMINAGAHRSLARESYLRCERAMLIGASKLKQLLRSGDLTATSAASAELVSRVQAILGASRDTKLEVRAALKRQGFIA